MSAMVAQQSTAFGELVQFHAHLDVIGIAAAMLIAYFYGLRNLADRYAPRGEIAVTTRQKRLFVSGVVLMVVVARIGVGRCRDHQRGQKAQYGDDQKRKARRAARQDMTHLFPIGCWRRRAGPARELGPRSTYRGT